MRLARGKPRHSQAIEIPRGQRKMERAVARHSPPVATKPRGHSGSGFGNAPSSEFPVDRRAPLPVFEIEGAQAPVQPLFHVGKDARRVGEAEVRPPFDRLPWSDPKNRPRKYKKYGLLKDLDSRRDRRTLARSEVE